MSLGCDSGWIGYNRHCYQRQNGGLTYNNAKDNCKLKGAIIAVPNTQSENSFLTSTMNPNGAAYTWIGFNYENSRLWEDGTTDSATNSWRVLNEVGDYEDRARGEPTIFMRADGRWSFDPKDESLQFVCEKIAGI